MEPSALQPSESEAILERIKKLCLRDDLATTALAMLEALSRKTCFTADDTWFLEMIEERYGIPHKRSEK